jgi:hypothetical protein
LRERAVYFEHWAIDALAEELSADVAVRSAVPPRLIPTARLDGGVLHYGGGKTTRLPPHFTRAIECSTGERTAAAIAAELVADGTCESAAEVYEILDVLVAKKLVIWQLQPVALVHPERELRASLAKIESADVRTRALAALDRIEAALARVASAVGDVAVLEPALRDLDAVFEEVATRRATRRHGEVYAGRTTCYEDCVRDLTVVVGRPVLDRIGPVLALVAQSARWFTYHLGAQFRARAHERFRKLGKPVVDYVAFVAAIDDLLPGPGEDPTLFAELHRELSAKWAAILALDMTRTRVQLRSADLADAVHHAFAAPRPGWPNARHVSPDVMIAARSADAIARGDATFVLGEVHVGNTNVSRDVIPHGPETDFLMRATELDLEIARITPVTPRQQWTRAQNMTWSTRDYDVAQGTSRSWRPCDHILRAGDLVVEERGDTLVVRHRTRDLEFDLVAFFESYLFVASANHFKPAPRAPHVPRVTIDEVVIAREQWRLTREQLPAIDDERGPDQLARIHAWASALGMPRWVFVKIPEEPKPVFVDFASPIFVDMFAKLARRASSAVITEMLPGVEDTWIPDAEGNTYTSELRIVMVDPEPWHPN